MPLETLALIRDHVFRAIRANMRPSAVGLCAYMNCGRTRAEHARAVTGAGPGRRPR